MQTRVMLVDETPERAEWIQAALAEAGCEVVALDGLANLYQEVTDREPDVVIIEAGSGRRDILEHLAHRRGRFPRPVLLFSHDNAPEAMRQAVRAGVSAYAAQDLSAQTIRSIIAVAVAQFEEYEALQQRLASSESKLADQKLLEQAKCLLMERHAISEKNAYGLLRSAAMERSVKLTEVARIVLKARAATPL